MKKGPKIGRVNRRCAFPLKEQECGRVVHSPLSLPAAVDYVRRQNSVLIASGVGFFITLIVLPFLHPLSLEFRDSLWAVHGDITHSNRDAQGVHRTEGIVWAMSGPLKRKRYSLTVGSLALHLDVVRDVSPGDYAHDE